jgi:hypothetical protein
MHGQFYLTRHVLLDAPETSGRRPDENAPVVPPKPHSINTWLFLMNVGLFVLLCIIASGM